MLADSVCSHCGFRADEAYTPSSAPSLFDSARSNPSGILREELVELERPAIVPCIHCVSLVDWGERACESCGTVMDEEEWVERLLFTVQEVNPDKILACCGRHFENCLCIRPTSWDQGQAILKANEIDPYDKLNEGVDGKRCVECTFFESSACPLLRKWMTEFIDRRDEQIVPRRIVACAEWDPFWIPVGDEEDEADAMENNESNDED